MTRRIVHAALVGAFVITTACAGAAPEPAMPDMEADLAAIAKVRDGYAAAFKAGDAVRIAALFTADGQSMEHGQPTASGAAAIESSLTGLFGMVTPGDIDITAGKTVVVGDVAYESGTYKNTVTPKDGGMAVTEEGRYLVVLRRQADGSWKLAANMGNSATMPAPMEGMPGK